VNMGDMRTIVRRELHDEDSSSYRWTNDELDRHIARSVKELSGAIPYEQKATESTVNGSREIDISTVTNRVMVQAIEYPAGQFPRKFQRFALWADTVTLLGPDVPDGSNAYIYYGKLHTLDLSTSTIQPQHEDLVASGACGYAAVEWAIYAINRVNVGGTRTPEELLTWGREKLAHFQKELKRLGRRNRTRVNSLYRPYYPPVSQTTDYGP